MFSDELGTGQNLWDNGTGKYEIFVEKKLLVPLFSMVEKVDGPVVGQP